MFWKRFFGRPRGDDAGIALYNKLVAQARSPQFYLHCGVPDSVNGRFEMVILHAYLVIGRLKGQGDAAAHTAQRVFDVMFDDMDQTIRELGVGDLSVGKKIRTMASAFYGRANAFDQGLAAFDRSGGDRTALEHAIRRNVFPDGPAGEADVGRLAAYVIASRDALSRQPTDLICAGELAFAPPPEESCMLETVSPAATGP